jgi:hypothetical protein
MVQCGLVTSAKHLPINVNVVGEVVVERARKQDISVQ